MKPWLRYAKLPISTPLIVAGLLVLILVLLLQGSANPMQQHLYLLIGSYLTWGFLLPYLQALVEEKLQLSIRVLLKGILITITLIIVHFLVSNFLYYGLQYLFSNSFHLPNWQEIKSFLAPALLSRFVDFVMFFGILCWLNQNKWLTQKRIELLETEAELQKSRFNHLKGQLNPHFLFNTLHTISALIGREDEKARKLTIKISELLRKTLLISEKTDHRLREELEIVEGYLSIEEERFKDRLTIHKQIDPDCLELMIPTMSLQPIVENAFKHGAALVEGKTELHFRIRAIHGQVEITVINDIAQTEPVVPSNGIGLKNLKERLQLYYGESFTLHCQSSEKKFTTQLILPSP